MKVIRPILNRKKKGIDCTEQESAEIKQFVKFLSKAKSVGNLKVLNEIATLLPIEYGEALSELETTQTELQ